MSAPAAALELRRAVWRHEHGRLPSGHAAFQGVNDEYLRALHELHAIEGDGSTIRAHAPGLLTGYDDALRRARRALEEEALGMALNHLLHARERMEAMRELLGADAGIRRAAEPVRRIWDAAGARRLRELPCVDAPTRLLALARERLLEGSWARAAYLASVSHLQVAPLQPDTWVEPARGDALRSSLHAMRALCNATRGLLPDPKVDLGGDGTLDALEALVADGFLALGERIVEELGALLASRARFWDALTQEDDRAAERIAELRSALGDATAADPWSAATRLLWRTRADERLRCIRLGQSSLEGVSAGAADDFIFQPENVR